MAQDQDIYRSSLEEHLKESTFKIRTWVTMNTPLIRLSMQEKREKEKVMTSENIFQDRNKTFKELKIGC